MIQINLNERVAKALEEKAQNLGLSLEAYLEIVAGEKTGEASPRLSADELISLIESEGSSGNARYTGTYPRSDIYFDHD